MMWNNIVSYLIRPFGKRLNLTSPCVALALGMVLGLLVLAVAPEMPIWSRHRLLLISGMALIYLATLVLGDIRRVLLLSLVLALPLNLAFAPLGQLPDHAGGAPAGVVLYPYDFPLIGLMVLWLGDILAKRKPVRFSSIDMAAVLFLIWSAVSIYNSSHVLLSLFELMRMTKLYLLSRVVASNVKAERDVQDVAIALLVGLMVQGVICGLQYALGVDLGLGLYTVGELRRVSGTVGWPNTLGAYAATILSLTLALGISGVGGRLRIPVGAASVAGFLALILSFSRGAWISLSAGVAVVLFLGWRAAWLRSRSLRRLSGIALVATMAGVLFAGPIVARLADVHPSMPVIVSRLQLNQVAVNMVSAHPLLGVGINTFVEEMKQYDTTGVTYYFPQPVHNVYLLVAAETGLVGLGLFLLLMLLAFRAGWQAAMTSDPFLSVCATGILGSLVVLAVNNLADVHLKTDVLYVLFWLLIALTSAVGRMRIPLQRSEGYDQDALAQSQTSLSDPAWMGRGLGGAG